MIVDFGVFVREGDGVMGLDCGLSSCYNDNDNNDNNNNNNNDNNDNSNNPFTTNN